jgi:hypothetical protein
MEQCLVCAGKMRASVCYTRIPPFSVKLSALVVIASALRCCTPPGSFFACHDPRSWKLGYFMLVYSLSEAVNLPQHTHEYACLVLEIKHTHNPCAEREAARFISHAAVR